MPKSLDIKVVPYVKENKLIPKISLNICILLSDIAIVDIYSIFVMFIVFLHGNHFVGEWSPYFFIKVIAPLTLLNS